MGGRKFLSWALGLVAAVVVGAAGRTAFTAGQVVWARRALGANFRRVQAGDERPDDLSRVQQAAAILRSHPGAGHDEVLAEVLRGCNFSGDRCSCYEGAEMPVLICLTERLKEGSVPARQACVDYLEASATAVGGGPRDRRQLCASMVDQQNLILKALQEIGDPGGLPAARKLAVGGVPLGIIEAVGYIGRFGGPADEKVLAQARARIEAVAPAVVRPVALITIERAHQGIHRHHGRAPDAGAATRSASAAPRRG